MMLVLVAIMKAGLRTLFSSQLLLELLDLHFSLAIVEHEVAGRLGGMFFMNSSGSCGLNVSDYAALIKPTALITDHDQELRCFISNQ